MINTNDRAGNEVWLHDMVMQMELDGQLGDFCRHIGIADLDRRAAELVWPMLKAHYTVEDGALDVARASRDFLTFPPTMEFMAKIGDKSRRK